MTQFCTNVQKTLFWARLGKFGPIEIFPEKSGSVTFLHLWTPNFMQNIRKKLMSQFRDKCVTNGRTNGRTDERTDDSEFIGPSRKRGSNTRVFFIRKTFIRKRASKSLKS